MATYVGLLTWTEQGIRAVKDTVKRADILKANAEKANCKVRELLWTMGPHDALVIYEAPSDEAASGLSIALGMQGHVRTLTMRAYTREEMAKIVAGLS